MGLDYQYISGQTPLDEDEKEGLRLPFIATRSELDEFEQKNIEEAVQWSLQRTFKAETVLTETFIRILHKRMYGDIWSWAGEFRKTNKNIGVDKWQIPIELKSLLDDVKFWDARKTYSPDELSLRLKHRLVSIHCFPNGNGRHGRLVADILIERVYKLPALTWGSGSMLKPADTRAIYLHAMRAADKGNIAPLMKFARS
jgi:Fic-DOC domain mobile mystery protein B